MPPKLVKVSNPATIAPPTGYSHVAEVRGGKLVFIAGQVSKDSTGAIVGVGDYRLQADQVFRNIGLALESAGATFRDVVKLTIFLRDAAHLPEVREARDRVIDSQHPPTSTAVQVSGLAAPEFLLEIDAVAAVK